MHININGLTSCAMPWIWKNSTVNAKSNTYCTYHKYRNQSDLALTLTTYRKETQVISYLFRADTIACNAFYAVKDQTSILTFRDLYLFCAMLDKHIQETSDTAEGHRNVIFNLDWHTCEKSENSHIWFAILGNKLANLQNLSDKDLEFINCHISSKQTLTALRKTREDFAAYLDNKTDLSQELIDCQKRLTVI